MIMSHHFNSVHIGFDLPSGVAGPSSNTNGNREPEVSIDAEEAKEGGVPPAPTTPKIKGKRKRNGRPLQDFFEFHYDSDAVKFALCKLCRTNRNMLTKIRMKNSNTTGIQKHLLRTHKNEYFEVNPGKSTQEQEYSYGIDNVTAMLETGSADEAGAVEYGEGNHHQVASTDCSGSTGRLQGTTGNMMRLRARRGKPTRLLSGGPEAEVIPAQSGTGVTETFEAFGAFVAAELRSLRHERNQKKLKVMIQKCIIEVAEMEDSA